MGIFSRLFKSSSQATPPQLDKQDQHHTSTSQLSGRNPHQQSQETYVMADQVGARQFDQTSTSQSPSPLKQDRITGSIRKLLGSYGFIAGDDGIDYFLHWSGMSPQSINFRRLVLQQRVSFVAVLGSDQHGTKSWRAVRVIVDREDLE
jgi:cold shock CspA family protein